MIILPFLPAAVQTATQGELSARLQVAEGRIADIRRLARLRRIVIRTVKVVSTSEPTAYWIFSQLPIPHDSEHQNQIETHQQV